MGRTDEGSEKDAAANHPFIGKALLGLVVAAVLVIGAAILWHSGASETGRDTTKWIIPLVYVVLALFLVGFLAVFTGRLTEKKVGYMIVYCYSFTWFFLIAPPLVFIGFPEAIDSPKPRDSPIGIVLGCAERPVGQQIDIERRTVPRDVAWMPKEIACGNNTPQWLLNIGGTVFPMKDLNEKINERRADYEATLKEYAAAETGAKLKDKPEKAEAQPKRQAPASFDFFMYEGLMGIPPGETLKQIDRVLGGVVVPLYFVIIALMGGLVSMMRRVPEYQRRIGPNAANRITCEEAREYLVFQIMQVFSAPLIAITAYYAFEPASRATSIALAFITGFSSETVLLHVRAITSKLQPETDAPAQLILTPSSVDFGKVNKGTKSAHKLISLTNRGTRTIHIREIAVTGEFQYTAPGAMTMPGGAQLHLEVFFTPSAAGVRAGKLTIASDAPASPHVVTLSGEGVATAANPV